jgi:hypothetical protein
MVEKWGSGRFGGRWVTMELCVGGFVVVAMFLIIVRRSRYAESLDRPSVML